MLVNFDLLVLNTSGKVGCCLLVPTSWGVKVEEELALCFIFERFRKWDIRVMSYVAQLLVWSKGPQHQPVIHPFEYDSEYNGHSIRDDRSMDRRERNL